jgi:lysozyme family protein
MRPKVMARMLFTATAIIGIAAGSVAGAGASFAATVTPAKPAVDGQGAVIPDAVVNLGLNSTQAKAVQIWLREFWGYSDAIDGQLGPHSWMAMQRFLRTYWHYTGSIDGIVGSGTVSELQRFLKADWGYGGTIDGIAGPQTRAAFARFANALISTGQ